MVRLAVPVLATLVSAALLNACTPKPASEPEAGIVVGTGPDDSQAVLDLTASFAKEEGYIHLGSAEGPRTRALHAHQFYRVDAQILASTAGNPDELQVYFYQSGGPITKSPADVEATAARYRAALQRSGLPVSIRPAE